MTLGFGLYVGGGGILSFIHSFYFVSTSLGTKHPLVLGIQVCLNERPHQFSRGDNSKNTLTTPEPLVQFNQTWHLATMGEGDSSFFSNEGPHPFQGEIISTFNCFHILSFALKNITQVSRVTH